MNLPNSRQDKRTPVRRVELVTVYRDEADSPYRSLLSGDAGLPEVHTVFSVVALLRDISQDGVGIRFEGQQIMAANLLHAHENYVVKLTLDLEQVPGGLTEYIRSEGQYYSLLLKMVCRWHEHTEHGSTAGFEMRPHNPPALVAFLRERFDLDGGDEE